MWLFSGQMAGKTNKASYGLNWMIWTITAIVATEVMQHLLFCTSASINGRLSSTRSRRNLVGSVLAYKT